MAIISPDGASPIKWAGEIVGKPVGRSAILLTNTANGSEATGKATISNSSVLEATLQGKVRY